MTHSCDILVIGGGIAGLSAAALLAKRRHVLVLEAEEQVGFHSSGRSATMLHYALGDRLIRELTRESRSFFDDPPDGFSEVPIGRPMPVLVHARSDELAALNALDKDLSSFAALERVNEHGLAQLCPVLRIGEAGAVAGIVDPDGVRLDPHALLQGNLRLLRSRGGELRTGIRVRTIDRVGTGWRVRTQAGETFNAGLLVNAAGAWADEVAKLAGVAPIGLEPKRRTIITFDAPAGVASNRLPFTKTVGDELYFAPESGRLFASPMDEVPTDPCDAQPDELEVALAAYRMEERTTVEVRRIHSRWAGLRSFAPDKHPVIGFAPDEPRFFWLAGQGGAGLQTSPAVARVVDALIGGEPWPFSAIRPDEVAIERLGSPPAQ